MQRVHFLDDGEISLLGELGPTLVIDRGVNVCAIAGKPISKPAYASTKLYNGCEPFTNLLQGFYEFMGKKYKRLAYIRFS